MSRTSGLCEQIASLLSATLNLDVPSVETDLFETGVLDSLAFVDLLLALEQRFGVTTSLDDLEVDNFRSIARIADFVIARETTLAN
jgi:D-alanine--poly(phosphoribitol) ligase subunit 2